MKNCHPHFISSRSYATPIQQHIEVGKKSFKELEKTQSTEIYILVVHEYVRAVLEQAEAVRKIDEFLKSVEGEKHSFPICPWGF